MNITDQFAGSPRNAQIRNLTMLGAGALAPIATGTSSVLMWRAKSRPSNTGLVKISDSNNASVFWTLDAGDDTGWIAGRNSGYFYAGTIFGEVLEIWEQL